MNPHITLIDPLKCSKCNLCSVKCKETHGTSRIKTVGALPHICLQCDDAPCKESCRVQAIYLKENIPLVDEERCVGCKLCLSACPFQAIYVKDMLASKCTLCLDSDRLTPACIEVCPDKILAITCNEDQGK